MQIISSDHFGDLTASGDVVIAATLHGSLTVRPGVNTVVAGIVNGPVTVQRGGSATIAGIVNGSLDCAGSVEIAGIVNGAVNGTGITIQPNAIINGVRY